MLLKKKLNIFKIYILFMYSIIHIPTNMGSLIRALHMVLIYKSSKLIKVGVSVNASTNRL